MAAQIDDAADDAHRHHAPDTAFDQPDRFLLRPAQQDERHDQIGEGILSDQHQTPDDVALEYAADEQTAAQHQQAQHP